MLEDETHRENFYDEQFWDGRKRHRQDKLLLHVFMYIYGSHEGPDYKRASEHALALQQVCDHRDIEVSKIPQHITEHGGFGL